MSIASHQGEQTSGRHRYKRVPFNSIYCHNLKIFFLAAFYGRVSTQAFIEVSSQIILPEVNQGEGFRLHPCKNRGGTPQTAQLMC